MAARCCLTSVRAASPARLGASMAARCLASARAKSLARNAATHVASPGASSGAASGWSMSMAALAPVELAPPEPALAQLTKADVLACQEAWATAIVSISQTYLEGGDFVGAASAAAAELYGYGHTNVLFKPTKATAHPFRPTGECAMSYFVGADAMGTAQFKGEDAGFAINGGKGWSKVLFKNHQVELKGDVAIAMGEYWFTSCADGSETRVEYTFGYTRCGDGKPRIFLHHSSVPYAA